jgi:hypothetical protein
MPSVLVVTMFISFQILTDLLDFLTGYLVSFVIYWIALGTIFPILILGTPRELANLFRGSELDAMQNQLQIQRVGFFRFLQGAQSSSSCQFVLVLHDYDYLLGAWSSFS